MESKKIDRDWLCMLPSGWHNMCKKMFEEIEEAFEKHNLNIEDLVIGELKEKWGSMRFYYSIEDIDNDKAEIEDIVERIVDRYEDLSTKICSLCGKEEEGISHKFVMPVCKECLEKREWY